MLRALKSLDLVPSGFFAFRTPLLPFRLLAAWSEGLSAATADDDQLEVCLARDSALLQERLRVLVADRVIREALFIASPSLDEAIEAWLKDPESERARGVVEILTRYLARMCARCTPFGLFSGCSVGLLGRDTRMTLAPRAEYVRHTRLDTHYLSALCEELEKTPEVRSKMRFRPSSGLYRTAGQLRYAEAKTNPESRDRAYCLVSIESTPYLEETLERAERGRTPLELAQALADADPSVSQEEASTYIDELIEAQVLVSELAPPMTGPEPIDDIVATLHDTGLEAIAERVAGVGRELDVMDRAGLGLGQDLYRSIADTLSVLPAKTELPRLFQVDLFKPAQGSTFGGAPLREMQRVLGVLARFRQAPRGAQLRSFREAFVARYEGREMPLVEVLDEERGIGLGTVEGFAEPSPLLAGLVFPQDETTPPSFERHDEWLTQRLSEQQGREWVLNAKDLEFLQGASLGTPPDALAVTGVLASSSPDALARGEFKLWISNISGPSGAVLLGRFCHGDKELAEHVRAHIRAEEMLRPDAIFAEIVHLPNGRLGNILCRPGLREHEILYLGRGRANEDKQISIADLRVSVDGDRIVLRSARLGREIIPRLTSAHNYSTGALRIYQFLCALQTQDVDSFGWSWGAVGRSFSRLPRITLGRTILSLAQWNLCKRDLDELAQHDTPSRFRAVLALRRRLGLPRWIGVADADNILTVDLSSVMHVESFVALLRNRAQATIRETFPTADEMCAHGPEGAFAHEIVVPFVRKETRPAAPPTRSVSLARSFPPGSEWLYAKIYVGTATADRVLTDVVAPLIEDSLGESDADSWFFVRYRDPHWHLRIRLHGDPAKLVANVIPRLYLATAPLLADGRVWRVSLDTYEREVERYGGENGMLLCEAIFGADSDAALDVQQRLSGDAAADARWRLTLRGMHLLLLDLGFDRDARLALVTMMRESFAAEHRVTGQWEKQVATMFRKKRTEIEWLLESNVDEMIESPLHGGFVALAERSSKLAPLGAQLVTLDEQRLLSPGLIVVAQSLLHMHANRVLRSAQRAHELVLYDFLARAYASQIGRARRGSPRPRP